MDFVVQAEEVKYFGNSKICEIQFVNKTKQFLFLGGGGGRGGGGLFSDEKLNSIKQLISSQLFNLQVAEVEVDSAAAEAVDSIKVHQHESSHSAISITHAKTISYLNQRSKTFPTSMHQSISRISHRLARSMKSLAHCVTIQYR